MKSKEEILWGHAPPGRGTAASMVPGTSQPSPRCRSSCAPLEEQPWQWHYKFYSVWGQCIPEVYLGLAVRRENTGFKQEQDAFVRKTLVVKRCRLFWSHSHSCFSENHYFFWKRKAPRLRKTWISSKMSAWYISPLTTTFCLFYESLLPIISDSRTNPLLIPKVHKSS